MRGAGSGTSAGTTVRLVKDFTRAEALGGLHAAEAQIDAWWYQEQRRGEGRDAEAGAGAAPAETGPSPAAIDQLWRLLGGWQQRRSGKSSGVEPPRAADGVAQQAVRSGRSAFVTRVVLGAAAVGLLGYMWGQQRGK